MSTRSRYALIVIVLLSLLAGPSANAQAREWGYPPLDASLWAVVAICWRFVLLSVLAWGAWGVWESVAHPYDNYPPNFLD